MNYQVVWSVMAEQLLADLWLAANDRSAVAAASHHIDQILATSPNTTGVPDFDTVRVYRRDPLGVEFEVIDADLRVFVLSVWDVNRGRPAPTGN